MKKINIPKFNQETYLFAYKLLNDVLFLALIAFIGTIFVEATLPEIITSHISFTIMGIVIIITMISIAWIANRCQIDYGKPGLRKSKSLPFLILAAFLLLGNSMLKFDLWENLSITIVMLFVIFLFYRQMFGSER